MRPLPYFLWPLQFTPQACFSYCLNYIFGLDAWNCSQIVHIRFQPFNIIRLSSNQYYPLLNESALLTKSYDRFFCTWSSTGGLNELVCFFQLQSYIWEYFYIPPSLKHWSQLYKHHWEFENHILLYCGHQLSSLHLYKENQ